MRLVHLSDLHLGFRAYARLTPAGINQREADVMATFRADVSVIIALAPGLVVIGGDVFHSVRPTNAAIVAAFNELARLVAALPRTIVVVAAGNHDMPKASDTGCILPLFASLGVHVVDRAARRLDFPDRDLSVLAVPDAPGVVRPALEPDPARRWNVLLMHGEVAGMLPSSWRASERPAVEIPTEAIGVERWDYVALGHYHVYRQLAPNMCYSGSIDYTSSNPWGELEEERAAGIGGKGIVERDLATGAHIFHALRPVRRLHNVAPIDATGYDASQLDAAIRAALEECPGGIDDAIVRLVVQGVARETYRALDQKALRDYKRRAVHFHLDWRPPDVERLGSTIGKALLRGQSIEEIVLGRMARRDVPASVNRDELAALAGDYLEAAREKIGDNQATLDSVPSLDELPAARKAS